jgi:hypothetical protein
VLAQRYLGAGCASFSLTAIVSCCVAGPMPLDLLEALWLAGEMDGLTLVWKEGMAEYVPVSQV